ncbi:uncharacterized protein ACRADG_007162 [Cochliomyia hominivorax]
MSSDNEEYRKFIIEFLQLYRSLPALWDVNCKDYTNRRLKDKLYDILLVKYHEQYPQGTKKHLKKKINGLRTNYRRELKRMKEDKSSTGPNLYYFNVIHEFLKDLPEPQESYRRVNEDRDEDFMKEDGEFIPEYYEQGDDDDDDEEPETSGTVFNHETLAVDMDGADASQTTEENSQPYSPVPSYIQEPAPKKLKKSENAFEDLVKLATARLKTPRNSAHLLPNVWADKLSGMQRQQRIIAEKLINEIMFNGELGLLNFNTSLINTTEPSMVNQTASSEYPQHLESFIISTTEPETNEGPKIKMVKEETTEYYEEIL